MEITQDLGDFHLLPGSICLINTSISLICLRNAPCWPRSIIYTLSEILIQQLSLMLHFFFSVDVKIIEIY